MCCCIAKKEGKIYFRKVKQETCYFTFTFAKKHKAREEGGMLQWLKYFLVGIAQTSEEAAKTSSKILELKSHLENTIQSDWGRRVNTALKLLNYLFETPVIRIKKVEKVCELSFKAANDLVLSFEKSNILKEITGQSRNPIFMFEAYISFFK